ncbi:MAG TPA: hypothetical protein VMV20_00570 [Chitinophagaceae bacterium]|nr:hypothetical protein [Chitinophagaceae bacterium]
MLVEASWQAIRRSPELLHYYRRHAVRNNKQAIIKVARKLALIAKGVVLRNQNYQTEFNQIVTREKIEN